MIEPFAVWLASEVHLISQCEGDSDTGRIRGVQAVDALGGSVLGLHIGVCEVARIDGELQTFIDLLRGGEIQGSVANLIDGRREQIGVRVRAADQ